MTSYIKHACPQQSLLGPLQGSGQFPGCLSQGGPRLVVIWVQLLASLIELLNQRRNAVKWKRHFVEDLGESGSEIPGQLEV